MSGLAGREFSGKSVEEATADGLRAMGLRAEEATVEVISKGSRGLFGIGSESALVRIAPLATGASIPSANLAKSAPTTTDAAPVEPPSRPVSEVAVTEKVDVDRPADEEPGKADGESSDFDDEVAAMGIEMLGEMVRLMGFDCTVTAAWHGANEITEERHLLLSVRGREASGLIGRRGETLENIQYLLRLMVNQRMRRWMNIIVDIEEFRARRVEHLTHLAQRMAQQVVESGRSQALEPMTPNERRIVHLVLRDDTRVFTESTGDGERRKVVIFPKR